MYIYQADLWCDSCGEAIAGAIWRDNPPPHADRYDESTYDSDDAPKYVGDAWDNETDCPSHCASGETCLEVLTLPSGHKVGALLEERLTSEGEDYVREALREGGEVAELWGEEFAIELDPAEYLEAAK